MSRDELRSFFLELLKTVSGAEIARQTGYTDGAISAVKNGSYKADSIIVLQAIFAKFGRWSCQVVGGVEVGHDQCQAEQKRPYSANRVQSWAACQKCERNDGGGK